MKHYACMDFTCSRNAITKLPNNKLLCGQCWLTHENQIVEEVAYFDQLR